MLGGRVLGGRTPKEPTGLDPSENDKALRSMADCHLRRSHLQTGDDGMLCNRNWQAGGGLVCETL